MKSLKPNYSKRFNHLLSTSKIEKEEEIFQPLKNGKPHVNWAISLTSTLEYEPSEYEPKQITHISNSSEKSILKDTKFSDLATDSDTDTSCSSGD
mmetsp:Transcript_15223/g.16942  ORF Transcript_15223/g.16942 Transcript_15223/m.16942 type:complete len:95 (-) Transcript_15223:287-571(-)